MGGKRVLLRKQHAARDVQSSSTIATGLTQPALAPLILTGKQHTVNPLDRPMADRLAIFSIWQ